MSEELVEAVARAIDWADGSIGYSIRLVRLIDEVSTYTLTYEDEEPLTFTSHADAQDHVTARRNQLRARAVIPLIAEAAAKIAEEAPFGWAASIAIRTHLAPEGDGR